MSHALLEPPGTFTEERYKVGGWWHTTDSRVVCDLCPRACSLKDGDAGFCFVRENRGGQVVLTTYGRSTGFCVLRAVQNGGGGRPKMVALV